MIQPFFYLFLLFAAVQLLFRITLLGFALVPGSAGTGVKLALIFLAAQYCKLYDRRHDANQMLDDHSWLALK
jgi:hypothetical protein